MKKNRVSCPVCGQYFDPRTPLIHITANHQHASEHDLTKIRDARRSCYGDSKPVKHRSSCFPLLLKPRRA